jgi:uncharacterized membrane protein YbhN (UPF0104 family)
MFSSWSIPIATGVAGTLLHKLTFYVVRYGIPVAGLAILGLTGEHLGLQLVDLASIALSVGILVVLFLVMHSTALARALGLRCGRLVRRLRHSVDPDGWARSWAEFHDNVAHRFHRGFLWAVAALLAMLAADSTMVVLSQRFVGVGDAVPTSLIVAAYLIAYPLTLFPFSGIGLIEAAVVAAIVGAGGHQDEAPAVAAMITWRVFALGGPMLMGAASLAIWHRVWGSGTRLWQLVRRGEDSAAG